MKHIVKLLMVTFLLSSVGFVYAQGPVDKTKDETVKVKSTVDKSTKGSKAGRLGDDTDAPIKDTGDETAVEGKKSFFGRLFGSKSAPEGHSSKATASSRGGSAKGAAPAASMSDKPTSSGGDKKPAPSGEKDDEGQGGEDKEEGRDGGR
ncbi:MAG TPA: hypothetical protein EYO79_08865 [Candidatus Marinimicrobia bacterium]|jgi:hypothetical protein|nr:hypothetical protein [Candidatus Neomarinimicrobiota bacterium]